MSLVGRNAFQNSLNYADLRIRIPEREPTTAEQAFRIAARYESYRVGSVAAAEGEMNRRHARVVNRQQGAAKDSWREHMESSVTDLQNGIEEVRSGMRLLLQQQQAATVSSPSPMPYSVTPASAVGLPPICSVAAPAMSSAASSGRTGVTSNSVAEALATTYTASKGTKRRSRDFNYFQCGQPGHLARNCSSCPRTMDPPCRARLRRRRHLQRVRSRRREPRRVLRRRRPLR
jgi:hypothetical protein